VTRADHGATGDKAGPSKARTIAALATPPGRGGIGVLRVSGPKALGIAHDLLGFHPKPRHAHHAAFKDAQGSALDHGIVLFFPAPASFTGEDVLELQGHGGPVVLDMLVARLLELGACLARPGEFSERAFLNGKLDLAQVEAIADLIDAGSEAAARSALRSLAGEFSRRIHALVEALIALRTYVEAAIDFPEEEIDFLSDTRIGRELEALASGLTALAGSAQQGCLLHDGMTVVLAGRPNSGKSSLLNALAQQESAIVSPTPGTTRDVVRERIQIDGLPLHILDTAGLRDGTDAVEAEGVRRARAALARADRVLLLVDDSHDAESELAALRAELPAGLPVTVVRNKIDLSGRASGFAQSPDGPSIALSAKTGAGLEALRAHLKTCMGFQAAGEGTFMARRRHLDAIARARAHVAQGQQLQQARAGELLAEELRLAQHALGEITGEFTPDDLLGRIFASFCIGK
jgi:tRNA modification GTPase